MLDAQMEIRWLASLPTSCLHAAAAFARGHIFADTQLAEIIAGPAQELRSAISASGMPELALWRSLLGLSSAVDNSRQLVELAVKKTVGPVPTDVHVSRLASCIASLQAAVRHAFPELLDELTVRSGPLQKHWEAVGPNLLFHVATLSDERLIVPNADVLLVQPALGGGGEAHILFNSVRIEAVIDDAAREIPEVLRLTWLVTQLNNDLPMFGDAINSHRLQQVAALAMVPLVLKSAERTELALMNEDTLNSALNHWHVDTPPDIDPVDRLWSWWETYSETRPKWSVALAALDRMFA